MNPPNNAVQNATESLKFMGGEKILPVEYLGLAYAAPFKSDIPLPNQVALADTMVFISNVEEWVKVERLKQ